MGRADDRLSVVGAVAALLVATAPDAGPQASDLLWRAISGRPLIGWTLQALMALDDLSYCALITPLERYDDGVKVIENDLSRAPGRVKVVLPTGANTWRRALASIEDIPTSCDWLLTVDATLPLVTTESLRAGLQAATRTGVAIAGEPVKETLKRVQGEKVVETPSRASLRRLFSPVIFRREAIWRVLDNYDPHRSDANDLVALAQLSGVPLTVFDAGYPAVRLTTERDLAIIETLLTQRESEAQ
jgi:2-C-methyl-D-erythritol 4-phosphate cytidylyltransferase